MSWSDAARAAALASRAAKQSQRVAYKELRLAQARMNYTGQSSKTSQKDSARFKSAIKKMIKANMKVKNK